MVKMSRNKTFRKKQQSRRRRLHKSRKNSRKMKGGANFKSFFALEQEWMRKPDYCKRLYWSVSVNDMPVPLEPQQFDNYQSLLTAVLVYLDNRGLNPFLGKPDYHNIMVVSR